jgi:hypothetical protein
MWRPILANARKDLVEDDRAGERRPRRAVRDRLADGVAGKVVDVDKFGLSLRLPLTSRVLEV